MPTKDAVKTFHEHFSNGISLAITVEGVARLDVLAVEGLMSDDDFFGHARVEVQGGTQLLPMFRSARMIITHNLDKNEGIVNGAFGVLINFNGNFAEVHLDTGVIAVVPRIAYERSDGSYFMAFPLNLGYAETLAKIQGQTIEHPIAIYPDASVPAGGYVAVTRVRCADNLWWYGCPTRQFFTPNS